MAEPDTARPHQSEQQTDKADGPAGDAALKAIAHLQQVAETLAADAAKLADDAPAKAEVDKKPEARVFLPALAGRREEPRPRPSATTKAPGWRARLSAAFDEIVWSQTAAAAFLMLAVAGGGYLGLMHYLDRKETQRLAAEESLRNPPETARERELRGKLAELSLEMHGLRAQVNKIAADARHAQTQAAGLAATTQGVARVEKLGKDLSGKIDQQIARIDRLERLAADPIVTSSVPKEKGQPTSAAGAPAPVRQGLRTPDPTMKPNTFVLRSVRNGLAMVQTRRGMLEVGPGDTIPGVGRVRAIEKMDGRWILVMHDGYIDQDDE